MVYLELIDESEFQIMVLKSSEICEQKMKEVDAKHLLFLWDREAAKQCWLELE